MDKAFAVSECKTVGSIGSGQFEALVSVFENVDHVKDRVKTGAFQRAVKEQDPPPIVWSHHWSIPPIGETLDWSESTSEDRKGLSIKGELFVGAEDNHMYADMAYAGMKSRGGRKPALREFSFSYDIPEGGAKSVYDETHGKVRELHELYPINEVGPCLRGCNPATGILSPAKAREAMGLAPMDEDARKAVSSGIHKLFADDEPLRKAAEAVLTKAYGDVEGYEMRLLLDMVAQGTSFIQSEDDPEDVATMRGIITTLLGLLTTEFNEPPDEGDAEGMAPFFAARSNGKSVQTGRYSPEVAELLLATPGH